MYKLWIMLAVACCLSACERPDLESVRTYEGPGYRLEHPANWEPLEESLPGLPTAHHVKLEGPPHARFMVHRVRNDASVTTESWVRAWKQRLASSGVQEVTSSGPKARTIFGADRRGEWFEHTVREETRETMWRTALFEVPGTKATLFFIAQAPVSHWEDATPGFDLVWRTLQRTPGTPP